MVDSPPPDPSHNLPALPPGFEAVPQHMQREQPQRARLTVVGDVYHYPAGGSPSGTPLRWTEQLETDEQPWKRWFTADGEWKSIEVGWIEAASLLVLINCEMPKRSDAIVELGVNTATGPKEEFGIVPFAELLPGRGLALPPPNGLHLARYAVRCRTLGTARCCLTLTPK